MTKIEEIRTFVRDPAVQAMDFIPLRRTDVEALLAEIDRLTKERDEAQKQQRYGWERAAEKDRAYGDMIAQRDAIRAAAERVVDEWSRWVVCDGLATLASIRAGIDALRAALAQPERVHYAEMEVRDGDV